MIKQLLIYGPLVLRYGLASMLFVLAAYLAIVIYLGSKPSTRFERFVMFPIPASVSELKVHKDWSGMHGPLMFHFKANAADIKKIVDYNCLPELDSLPEVIPYLSGIVGKNVTWWKPLTEIRCPSIDDEVKRLKAAGKTSSPCLNNRDFSSESIVLSLDEAFESILSNCASCGVYKGIYREGYNLSTSICGMFLLPALRCPTIHSKMTVYGELQDGDAEDPEWQARYIFVSNDGHVYVLTTLSFKRCQ